MRFIHFFRCFLSVYTQYLWPISPISPMQCFYGPYLHFNGDLFSLLHIHTLLLLNVQQHSSVLILMRVSHFEVF